MNPKKRMITLTVPLLLGLLLLIGFLQGGQFISAENSKATPTIDDPVGKRLNAEIETYKKDLKTPKLSPEARKVVEANKKYAEKEATKRADNLAHQDELSARKQTFTTKETKYPSFPQVNEKTKEPKGPTPGIHNDVGFPYIIKDAGFINGWFEPDVDEDLWYLAGESTLKKDQGVLFIYHVGSFKVERFYLEENSGCLKITGFEANRIKLSSEKDNKTYFFDIHTHAFFDENGSILIASTLTSVPTTTLPAYP